MHPGASVVIGVALSLGQKWQNNMLKIKLGVPHVRNKHDAVLATLMPHLQRVGSGMCLGIRMRSPNILQDVRAFELAYVRCSGYD